EMNTRIQVEHPVTEMITGIDLVKEQIRVAEGHPLSFSQEEISINGHAIEARIYAEDPEKEFMPATGRIETFQAPDHKEARIDSGFLNGNLVEPWYDPMLAKVITRGASREDARNQLIRILKDFRITGLRTNRDFLIELLRSIAFKENTIHTSYVDRELDSLISSNQESRNAFGTDLLLTAATLIALQNQKNPERDRFSPWHAIGHWRLLPEMTLLADSEQYRIRYELQKGRQRMHLHVGDRDFQVALERRDGDDYWIRIDKQVIKVWGITDRSEILLDVDGHLHRLRRLDILDRRYIGAGDGEMQATPGEITAPLSGRVVQINVKQGDQVTQGDPLLVIESMKMENKILATHDASVDKIEVSVGDQVQTNQLIITLASI
ncbi:MAG: biotin/lipoyl-binding protein, partial [Bacteroidales bacterium]|nr:biotin/lipoyl-binding protein [Bacteroidales bacterium]